MLEQLNSYEPSARIALYGFAITVPPFVRMSVPPKVSVQVAVAEVPIATVELGVNATDMTLLVFLATVNIPFSDVVCVPFPSTVHTQANESAARSVWFIEKLKQEALRVLLVAPA